jgi:hypothetical protein
MAVQDRKRTWNDRPGIVPDWCQFPTDNRHPEGTAAVRLAPPVTGTAGHTVSVNPPSGVSVVPVM